MSTIPSHKARPPAPAGPRPRRFPAPGSARAHPVSAAVLGPVLALVLALGLSLSLSLALGLGGCGRPSPRARVVAASVPPVAELTALVAGDRLPVVTMLPPGRSPHDFEPSAADVDRIRNAVLIVYAGPDPDGWMRRSAEAGAGKNASFLTLREVAANPDLDPHLWLNLDVVEAFLPVLAESLAAVDPEGAPGFRARAAAAVDSLRAFDASTRALLEPVRGVPFAILHPAFENFVRRYGLDLVAVLQLHVEGEIAPRTLGRITRALEESGATVVFAEPQLSRRMAEATALEIGGRVAVLDPLGGPDVPGRDTYLGLLRWNARSLAENLGRAAP